MQRCVFCDIVKGKQKADIIYEDKKAMVVLHKNAITEGHAIIFTKTHYKDIFDVKQEEFEHVIDVAKKLSLFYKKELRCKGINILQASGEIAGQKVNHFHIQLIPRYANDGLGNLWNVSTDKCVNNFLVRGRLLTSKYFKMLGSENKVKPIKQ
ncbi:MAG: HIT family protein [Candidatus Micrarchaeia archaeon]